MTEIEWWEYDDAAEMAAGGRGRYRLRDRKRDRRARRGVVALPGGKTPLPIYEKLAATKLDWKRVTIIPTDERIVPLGDPLSNVTTIGKAFLPKGARVIPIVSEAAADYKAAGKAADARLQRPALAARPLPARRRRRRPHRLDLPRPRSRRSADRPARAARAGRDARSAARRSAGGARHAQPRRDRLGARADARGHRRREAQGASRRRSSKAPPPATRSAGSSPMPNCRSTSTGARA